MTFEELKQLHDAANLAYRDAYERFIVLDRDVRYFEGWSHPGVLLLKEGHQVRCYTHKWEGLSEPFRFKIDGKFVRQSDDLHKQLKELSDFPQVESFEVESDSPSDYVEEFKLVEWQPTHPVEMP